MTMFERHTIPSAPEGSRSPMTRLQESAGLVPNLAAMMAGAPALIDGFVTLRAIYQQASLDVRDREILGLSNAVANGCEWCVAFHSFVALKLGIDRAIVDAIRDGTPLADPKARALHRFTIRLIEQRGAVAGRDLEDFIQAGFTKQQALEGVAGCALSLMANYAGNFVDPDLDGFLGDLRWSAVHRS